MMDDLICILVGVPVLRNHRGHVLWDAVVEDPPLVPARNNLLEVVVLTS